MAEPGKPTFGGSIVRLAPTANRVRDMTPPRTTHTMAADEAAKRLGVPTHAVGKGG